MPEKLLNYIELHLTKLNSIRFTLIKILDKNIAFGIGFFVT